MNFQCFIGDPRSKVGMRIKPDFLFMYWVKVTFCFLKLILPLPRGDTLVFSNQHYMTC